jgi:hypothetical protein
MLAFLEFSCEADIAGEIGAPLCCGENPIKETMITPIDKTLARLIVLEAALGGRIASRLAGLSVEESQKWKADFVRALKGFDFSGRQWNTYKDEVFEAEFHAEMIACGKEFIAAIAISESENRTRNANWLQELRGKLSPPTSPAADAK